jgi:hypothetical protein
MTPIGYIVLPIGLAALFLSKKWLYRCFVFSTLFSATSAVNFGAKDSGSSLQLWMFFGFLWLLRLVLDNLSSLSFSIDGRIRRPCLWLIAFLFVATFSLLMPLYIDGSLLITSTSLIDNSETPLYLTSHNFTQLLYLVFGVVTAICVAHVNFQDSERLETERIILFSAIFVTLWGFLQLVCNQTGVPYPDFIFNNSASVSGKGFMESLNGVARVSSVATEPSILAQSINSLLPLTIPAWLRRGSVLSVPMDRFCTVLFIILLIISTSSSAYLGMFILVAILCLLLVHTRTASRKRVIAFAVTAGVIAVSIGAIAAVSVPKVRDLLGSILLDKSSSGSALERSRSVVLAFGYFQKYPILGIGWGSATSFDLVVLLLATVGIIGTFVFGGAMWSVLRANWRAMEQLILPEDLSRAAWFLGLAVFLFASLIIGFPLAFGNFWLILGMALSTAWKAAPSNVPEPSSQTP